MFAIAQTSVIHAIQPVSATAVNTSSVCPSKCPAAGACSHHMPPPVAKRVNLQSIRAEILNAIKNGRRKYEKRSAYVNMCLHACICKCVCVCICV